MLSERFFLQIIIRIVLLIATSIGLAFALMNGPIYISMALGIFLVFHSISLIRYINRSNKKIAFFFESVKNEDFSLKFPKAVADKSFRELHQRINELNGVLQRTCIENRKQETYFREVLQQVNVGILSYNSKGHILFANPSIKQLLNSEQLNHIRQLEQVHPSLYEVLMSPSNPTTRSIKTNNERENKELSLKTNTFQVDDENITLLTLQDINMELEEKETDSWLKLIRVLTHEIMNSLTPIASITSGLLDNFKPEGNLISSEELNEKRIENTAKGLEVIKAQGNDLMQFVQSYRGLLQVSPPNKELISVQKILNRIELIYANELAENGVQLEIHVSPNDLELFADPQQVTQILINLVKNALQALNDQQNKRIQLNAYFNDQGNPCIEVRDNGPGIEESLREEIFIPFFTTKATGSGIGLSVSKHIMRLHEGSIRLDSKPGERTSFFLEFKK